MKKPESEALYLQIAHEDLQRMARDKLGRLLTEQELRAAAEQLLHGIPADQAFHHFFHHGHQNHG